MRLISLISTEICWFIEILESAADSLSYKISESFFFSLCSLLSSWFWAALLRVLSSSAIFCIFFTSWVSFACIYSCWCIIMSASTSWAILPAFCVLRAFSVLWSWWTLSQSFRIFSYSFIACGSQSLEWQCLFPVPGLIKAFDKW